MTLNLSVPGQGEELKPRITVFGVGGAGGNAVNNMIEKELEGVDFVVANTDAQALQQSRAQSRVQLGVKVTEGLGAGAKPSVGAAAAEESIEQIVDHLAGAHMCFITAGMGGGTGTGAAPIIAQAARELGVLTVGVVTKPFQFEGNKRMRQAEEGVEALQKMVDTLIIIPNQNLFRLANEKTTFTQAFSLADDVLYQGVKGVTDLMVRPGLINLDFADVRAVMDEMGKAMMGTGEADGETRAIQAAEKAIANPLLDEISLRGARGVLINITGGHDLTLFELDEAANRIREEVDPDANIIVGSTLDESMEGRMRVSVVATGIDATEHLEIPVPRRKLSEPLKPAARVEEDIIAAPASVAASTRNQPAYDVDEDDANAPTLFEEYEDEQSGNAMPAAFGTQKPAARPVPVQHRPVFDSAPRQHSQPARGADDLPPPAYKPRPAASGSQNYQDAGAPDTFVAPQPRRPGQPSPEALARLQAAVGRAPRPAPQIAQAEPAAPPRRAEQEKSRFGINSLINRMTGSSEPAEDHRAPAPQPRHQPAMRTPEPAPRMAPKSAPQTAVKPAAAPKRAPQASEPEQDRIEIPAFLRRQAN
jgi:cell division protein FtsZ